jgi:D-alanyl-D-alanine carboxypeptidase
MISFRRLSPRFPLALLLAVLSPTRPTVADPPTPAPATATLDGADLDTFAVGQMSRQGWIGLSLAVVQDGQITATKYYGLVSRESGQPVGADTEFAIGSVTKQFTAACILLLAEDGKLSVHDPVSKYYPTLTRASDITLLDLMNHVSGYRDYYPLDFVDARMSNTTMPDVVISQYATKPLDFDPGTRWSYSNTGYLILGRIIEKVSGQPYAAFLKSRLLAPLGLTHTQYGPPADAPGLAQGYRRFALSDPTPAPREASGWLGAAGALYSTPTDLAKWDIALMSGRVLKPESLTLMTAPRMLTNGLSDGYGAGLFVRTAQGQAIWDHSGAVSGFQAENELIPSTHSAVIVTVSSDYGDPGTIVRHVEPALLAATPSRSVPVVNGPAPDTVARELVAALEKGRIDRRDLGDAYSVYLTPETLRAAAKSLKGWGRPSQAQTLNIAERGGMEVSTILLSFDKGLLTALLYRTPDGKIQEFFLSPE